MLCTTLSFLKIPQNKENTTTNIIIFDLFSSLTCISCYLLNHKNLYCPILVFWFYFFFCCIIEIVLRNRPDVGLLSLHCKPVKTESKFQNSWKPVRQKSIFLRTFQRRHTVIIEGTVGEKHGQTVYLGSLKWVEGKETTGVISKKKR